MSSGCRKYVVWFLGMNLLLAGCRGLRKYETIDDGEKVPEETLRQVDPLELEPATPPDLNEVKAKIAPERMELTLAECRSMALQNNLHLRTRLADPVLAQESLNQERAKFEAVFSGTGSYEDRDDPTTDTSGGNQGSTLFGNIGVAKPLATGGSMSVRYGDTRNQTDSIFAPQPLFYNNSLVFSVTQPLLRNAGKRANTHSIRIASYGRQMTDARTKAEVIATIRAMDGIYWYLYAYRQELEVRKQQYELAQAQLENTRHLVDIGDRAPVEMIRAEAGLADRQEAIIIAGNNVRIQERLLKNYINHDDLSMDGPTRIIPASPPQPRYYDLDPNELVTQAVENRMDMLEIELQLAQDTSNIRYQRSLARSDITLRYDYRTGGVGSTFNDAAEMLADQDFSTNVFNLGLSIPLGNKVARSRLRQAIYARGQRITTRKNKEALIQLEVLDAIDNVEAAWLRIIASQENAELQGRLAQAEQRQFELGARTATEVLDAQSKLADAQSAEIRALAAYQRSLIDLAYFTGTLLGAANVDWEPIVPGETSDS